MLKKDQDAKIFILGFGYLMEYISPCYIRMLGENLKTNVTGTTVDDKDIARKQAKFGFPIQLGGNLAALERAEPDIILFAPQPSFAPGITQNELKPYYDGLRAKGKPLPDLYAFPPSPDGKFYLDLLGDINVVNIIPNMFSSIAGKDVSKEGFNMLTLPDGRPWPEENAKRLDKFFEPLGKRIYVGPKFVYSVLAASVCSHTIYEMVFTLSDALAASRPADARGIASAMRHHLQQQSSYTPPEGSTPCSEKGVEPALYEALKKIAFHWKQGIVRSLEESGVQPELAKEIQDINMDLHLHALQLESRASIEKATRQHATKGGVLEKGCITFAQRVDAKVRADFQRFPSWTPDAQWAEWLEGEARHITDVVTQHGGNLSRKSEKLPCRIEHHAAMFALLARAAVNLAGEKGKAAVMDGLALYGRERGGRMAERALEHGDPAVPMSYQAYGEWTAAPGQMQVDTAEKSPEYVTRVRRCEWCESWKKHGLLEYGKLYCEAVDKNLALGFNPDYHLRIDSLLSGGDACCEFHWGFEMTPQAEQWLTNKKTDLGLSCTRDFDYHTAHIFDAVSRELRRHLGEELGKDAADTAFFDYTKKFGREYAAAIENVYPG